MLHQGNYFLKYQHQRELKIKYSIKLLNIMIVPCFSSIRLIRKTAGSKKDNL